MSGSDVYSVLDSRMLMTPVVKKVTYESPELIAKYTDGTKQKIDLRAGFNSGGNSTTIPPVTTTTTSAPTTVPPAYAEYATPGDYSAVAPAGAKSATIEVQAGGGGGSGGSDGGYGHYGPGGFGGKAGQYVSTTVAVNGGSSALNIHVGAGGSGSGDSCCWSAAGANGDYSAVTVDGAAVATANGGVGGAANSHCNDGVTCGSMIGGTTYQATFVPDGSDGGSYTCPNGGQLEGFLGNYVCRVGGYTTPTTGENSHYASGGSAAGRANTAGVAGSYGSGGGGGGCVSGSCVGASPGGNGGNGYVKITWNY